jgi:acetolactate synthase I/II/III large subunit
MLLSDYVVEFLVQRDIKDIFLVSGGGIMYLLDSLGRNKKLNYYCNYHEQACAISAEAYARIRKGVGVCMVTTGPGGANAVSALPAAWVDSVPTVVICGQVKRELIADYDLVRQIGPQEGNIVGMAKPVTKYAKSIRDPASIRYELEYAFYQAVSGRPGPVLLEIPLDVQGADIEPQSLKGFTPREIDTTSAISSGVSQVLEILSNSNRPILVCGNGIHRARAEELLLELLDVLEIPIVLPLTAKDIIDEAHPCNMGVFGTAGQRRANFAVQNSDCLLAIGAGLNVQKIGFNVQGFAPKAKKIIVDIDEAQLIHQVVRPDLGIRADAAEFISELLRQLRARHPRYRASSRWTDACEKWKKQYPLIVSDYFADPAHVNSYVFMDVISDLLKAEDIVVTGNALDTTSYFQAFRVKRNQRTMNSGWGAMGWCLPMALGACIGSGKMRTVCITGDGSFQFNVQELLTIQRYDLPIKVFILNNEGYSNIRATQNNFFEGRYVGADFDSGVANPDFRCLSAAYGFSYSYVPNQTALDHGLRSCLESPGRSICEINVSPTQGIAPKASAYRRPDGTFESRPLEDMAPFLPREEVWENMHMFDDE